MSSLLTAVRWLAGDDVRRPPRTAFLLAAAVSVAALAYGTLGTWRSVAPFAGQAQPALAPDHDDVKFEVPLEKRKEIFAALALAEPNARAEGTRQFNGPGLEWSAEDHRGAFERRQVGTLAAQEHLTITQVYLILDEGIREHWPSPDGGAPLDGHTVPLNPRRKYGF